jgi:hypothetical protein
MSHHTSHQKGLMLEHKKTSLARKKSNARTSVSAHCKEVLLWFCFKVEKRGSSAEKRGAPQVENVAGDVTEWPWSSLIQIETKKSVSSFGNFLAKLYIDFSGNISPTLVPTYASTTPLSFSYFLFKTCYSMS